MRLRNLDSGPFHTPPIVEPTITEPSGKEKLGKVLHPAFVIAKGESSPELSAAHAAALKDHPIIIARSTPHGSKDGKPVRLLAWEGEDAPERGSKKAA